jgi:hypothetical protein
MSIHELVVLAVEKDPKFKLAIHKLVRRGKNPNFMWLMRRIQSALGEEFTRSAALDYRAKQDELKSVNL